MNYNSPNVYVVGAVDNPSSRIIRVVHISHTMGCEENILQSSQIPFGHILIHSGDFGKKSHFLFNVLWRSRALMGQIDSMNRFFSALPHPHKIYAPCDDNDSNLSCLNPNYVQSLLPSVTYLKDSSLNLYSLNIHASVSDHRSKFYKSHFRKLRSSSNTDINSRNTTNNSTLSNNDAFNNVKCDVKVSQKWLNVPESTDILISRFAPWNSTLYSKNFQCHKPMLHLYGRHDGNYGVLFKDHVVFSNASYRAYTAQSCNRGLTSYYYPSSSTVVGDVASAGYCNYGRSGVYDNVPNDGDYNSSNDDESGGLNCLKVTRPRWRRRRGRVPLWGPDFYLRSVNANRGYQPLVFDVYVPTVPRLHNDDDGDDEDDGDEDDEEASISTEARDNEVEDDEENVKSNCTNTQSLTIDN